jgi:hypothetical protein
VAEGRAELGGQPPPTRPSSCPSSITRRGWGVAGSADRLGGGMGFPRPGRLPCRTRQVSTCRARRNILVRVLRFSAVFLFATCANHVTSIRDVLRAADFSASASRCVSIQRMWRLSYHQLLRANCVVLYLTLRL